MDPFAIGTYPCGAVADTPFVFSKTFRAYLESANTPPAEGFLFFAAIALVPFFLLPTGNFYAIS